MKQVIKALIVEDETAAATNLQMLLKEVEPSIEIEAVLDTIVDTVAWFESKNSTELVFMDIHLADGDAFNIFNKTDINCPIIFTTAYDQYALEAFKVNSVDYILKPIKADDLKRALDKIKRLSFSEKEQYIERTNKVVYTPVKQAFLIPVRDKLVPLNYEDIAYCYTFDEKVTAYCKNGTNFPLDKSLDTLMTILPDEMFFRANRQFIVARDSIKDMSVWFGSRLSINLKIETPERIIVSKARVREFKKWFVGD